MNIELTEKITKIEGLTDGTTYFIQALGKRYTGCLDKCDVQLIQSSDVPDEDTIGVLNNYFKVVKKAGLDFYIKLNSVYIGDSGIVIVVEEC